MFLVLQHVSYSNIYYGNCTHWTVEKAQMWRLTTNLDLQKKENEKKDQHSVYVSHLAEYTVSLPMSFVLLLVVENIFFQRFQIMSLP